MLVKRLDLYQLIIRLLLKRSHSKSARELKKILVVHFIYIYIFFLPFVFFLSLFDYFCIDGLRSASPNKASVNLNLRSSSVVATAASASVVATPTTPITKTPTCCNCFGPLKKQWDDDAISNQMSEVYCRACDEDDRQVVHIPKNRFDSPAILTNVTKRNIHKNKRQTTAAIQPKVHSIFSVESELEMPNITTTILDSTDTNAQKEIIKNNKNSSEDFELGDDAVVSSDKMFSASDSGTPKPSRNTIEANETIRVVRGKEELPVSSEMQTESILNRKSLDNVSSSSQLGDQLDKSSDDHKSNELNLKAASKQLPDKVICTHDHPLILHDDNKINANGSTEPAKQTQSQSKNVNDKCNNNNNNNQSMTMSTQPFEKHSIFKRMHRMYSTLPKMKKVTAIYGDTANCGPYSIPSRTTPDGTTIYYMCDLSKNVIKGCDFNSLNFVHRF